MGSAVSYTGMNQTSIASGWANEGCIKWSVSQEVYQCDTPNTDKGNKDNEEGIKGGMKGGLYNVG